MMAELAMMKGILRSTNDDDDGGKKKKTERLVYQLACKKCGNKPMNFVGTTDKDLKTTMSKHFKEVIRMVKSKGKEDTGRDDQEYARHFAKHCKPSLLKKMSDKDIIKFCRTHTKIEVLRRHDGAELYWEEDAGQKTASLME